MSFESDLKRMEEITDLLKNEETGLEESIKLYEEASALGKKLTKTLTEIQRKVERVTTDDEMELETADMDEEETF
ncbi:MAG: exodeoxyribonuclease VII small subunit [Spirochaetes bacterium]|uniref:Exodeoxyribonuclease 7 small subunit n=1 Tax=Candidatus Ornithospirochaeta stercoripullorum TaxID=2840899 RepID=A0A9D9E1V0_9SPIO|nr:exodeoxyribonuclease VII small subunit [Candidatus Ornithospirochaeta stercoripullorum]